MSLVSSGVGVKGELARRLRDVEKKVNRFVGYKTKIVEGVGNKFKDLMPNSNPLEGSTLWKG